MLYYYILQDYCTYFLDTVSSSEWYFNDYYMICQYSVYISQEQEVTETFSHAQLKLMKQFDALVTETHPKKLA